MIFILMMVMILMLFLISNAAVTGFGFGSGSGSGLPLSGNWHWGLFTMSLFYTLPQTSGESIDNVVVLKFQSLWKLTMSVYGRLANNRRRSTRTHLVQLNECKLSSSLKSVLDVIEFSIDVKDNLAMRLLTDIREESGLEPPTCFTILPKDLKLKILESFSITELANVSRVNSEMRGSASRDELW
ncbi:hypothetical protein MIMGU_mgv1a023168mg [Erythranthe guttata]|uniref:F-box domain-containing protein n=1 Tax=Erythranthe guttata TaxID=4155 RepID=A0A022RBB7_ERYGU|nr:hypothetical protein MIMGU_mgv1a023168mg [Erythranthe guttata]